MNDFDVRIDFNFMFESTCLLFKGIAEIQLNLEILEKNSV